MLLYAEFVSLKPALVNYENIGSFSFYGEFCFPFSRKHLSDVSKSTYMSLGYKFLSVLSHMRFAPNLGRGFL